MTRYILAFGMLGIACLAYLILAFGARFNRTDELTGDGQPEPPVADRVKLTERTRYDGLEVERIKQRRPGHHGKVL